MCKGGTYSLDLQVLWYVYALGCCSIQEHYIVQMKDCPLVTASPVCLVQHQCKGQSSLDATQLSSHATSLTNARVTQRN